MNQAEQDALWNRIRDAADPRLGRSPAPPGYVAPPVGSLPRPRIGAAAAARIINRIRDAVSRGDRRPASHMHLAR